MLRQMHHSKSGYMYISAIRYMYMCSTVHVHVHVSANHCFSISARALSRSSLFFSLSFAPPTARSIPCIRTPTGKLEKKKLCLHHLIGTQCTVHLDGRKGHYLISIPSTVPPMAGFTPADTLKRQPVRPRKEHTLHAYCTKSEKPFKLLHVYVINQTHVTCSTCTVYTHGTSHLYSGNNFISQTNMCMCIHEYVPIHVSLGKMYAIICLKPLYLQMLHN